MLKRLALLLVCAISVMVVEIERTTCRNFFVRQFLLFHGAYSFCRGSFSFSTNPTSNALSQSMNSYICHVGSWRDKEVGIQDLLHDCTVQYLYSTNMYCCLSVERYWNITTWVVQFTINIFASLRLKRRARYNPTQLLHNKLICIMSLVCQETRLVVCVSNVSLWW